jgi:hypothetical protein
MGIGIRDVNGLIRNFCALTLAVIVAPCLLWLEPLGAQSTVGTIVGTVTDASGTAVPAATMTVTNVDTGVARTVVTDASGSYQIPRLLPGNYSISAERAGFRKALVTGIVLQVNQEARYDLRLEVGELAQQIEVSAQGVVQVQADDVTLGQVVDQKKIEELPLNGRNFLQLITIGAGAAPILQGQGGAITGETKREGLSYTVSGQREVSMSYLIDGVEAKSNFEMMSAIQPSLDAIQEFKLQRNAFSAEFGGAPVLINIAVKSGTNRLHGSAFEFLRNDKLDASQIQDPVVNGSRQRAPFRLNQFGASIGGPVFLPKLYNGKNRTFFFFDYEGLRRRRFSQFIGRAIPTRFRGGDFSTLTDPKGNPIPIFDPTTYNATTGLRQQFPGNVIPSNRFDPLAKKFLDYFPAPQNEYAPLDQPNSFVGRNESRDDNQYHVRIDQIISEKTTLFGRFSGYRSPILSPLGYAAVSTENFLLQDKNLAINVTHSFSPRTLNEMRFGYNSDRFDVIPYNPSGENVGQALGIKNLNPRPQQYGFPSVGGVTFTGIGPYNWDIVSGGKLFQYHDILTLIRGKHTLKIGADISNMRPWQLAEDTGLRPAYSFTGDFTSQLRQGSSVSGTGSDIADLLLGIPQNADGGIGSTYTEFTWTNYHAFIQDDIKISPGLTLSLGFRYEYNMHPKPRDNKLEGFCPTCVDRGFLGKLVLTDKGEVRSQVVDPDWRQFGPRLGFAWSPRAGGSTVLRGAFGIFYDPTKGDELNFEQFHPDKTQFSNPINETTAPTFFVRDSFPVPPPGFSTDPFVVNLRDRWPKVYQWNMNVQHKFAREWLLEIGYVGSHGQNLSKRWNLNQARLDADPTKPTPIKSRQPFPLYGVLLDSSKTGISNYNGLQIRGEKTFSHGFNLLVGYTWSRCQDEDSSASFAADNQNAYNFAGDYGLCGFQIKNRFNASGTWEIPLGRGLKGFQGAVVKGWQLNAILQIQSGSPFTPSLPGDPARVGARYLPRFDRVCDGNLPKDQQTVLQFFNTNCFVPGQPGLFGSSGRNVIIGPGFKSADFSLFKNFRIREAAALQFRSEFFNTLNNGNYNQPGSRLGFTFGKILTELEKREIQFGLRMTF